MFQMGDDFMSLPLKEKMKYEQGGQGNSFGCLKRSSAMPKALTMAIAGIRREVPMPLTNPEAQTEWNISILRKMMLCRIQSQLTAHIPLRSKRICNVQ